MTWFIVTHWTWVARTVWIALDIPRGKPLVQSVILPHSGDLVPWRYHQWILGISLEGYPLPGPGPGREWMRFEDRMWWLAPSCSPGLWCNQMPKRASAALMVLDRYFSPSALKLLWPPWCPGLWRYFLLLCIHRPKQSSVRARHKGRW